MARILVIEDSEDYQQMAMRTLGNNHEVVIEGDGHIAIDRVKTLQPHLILLDVILPSVDGFLIAENLQSDPQTRDIPILFVTSKNSPEDIVKGFRIGADDYITKPYHALELKARCEAKLNKLYKTTEVSSLQSGVLKLDLLSQRAFVHSETPENDLKLTPGEFRLLIYFIKNEGKTLSRGAILNHVTGETFRKGDRSVDAYISSLRKKSDVLTRTVQSIYREGYIYKSQLN